METILFALGTTHTHSHLDHIEDLRLHESQVFNFLTTAQVPMEGTIISQELSGPS